MLSKTLGGGWLKNNYSYLLLVYSKEMSYDCFLIGVCPLAYYAFILIYFFVDISLDC